MPNKIRDEKAQLFSFIAKRPVLVDAFSPEDLNALSGLNEMRDAMIDYGVRSYYVTFIDRDGNVGYLWRNATDGRLQVLAESMIERGLQIGNYLNKKDPHNPIEMKYNEADVAAFIAAALEESEPETAPWEEEDVPVCACGKPEENCNG